MRKLLIGLVGLVAVAAAAALVLPGLVDWNGYKSEIAAEAKAATGRDLAIAGDVSLALLPAPRLSASKVRFANAPGASAPDMARLDSLEVRIKLLPLLTGRIEIESVTLVRPEIELERLADGRGNWQFDGDAPRPAPALGAAARRPAAPPASPIGGAFRLDSLRIVDGTLAYRDAKAGTAERIERLNAELSAQSLAGPFRVTGRLTARGLPLTLDATLGALTGTDPAPVAARLGVAGVSGRAEIVGSLHDVETAPRFDGRVKAEAGDLALVIRALAAPTGPAPDLPEALSRKFAFAAQVKAHGKGAAIDALEIELGEANATGGVKLAIGERIRADVTLAVNRLALDPWLATTPGGAAPDGPRGASAALAPAAPAPAGEFALPRGVNGSIDLTIQALDAMGGSIRDVKLAASLNEGEVTLSQATARLPGGAQASLFGFLAAPGGKPAFEGAIEAQADDLRGVLQWLEADVAEIPPDRLRRFALAAKVKGWPDNLQLLDVDARLDSSRLRGGVVLALRDRPGFGASLDIDHLNLDAYLPKTETRPGTAPAASGRAPAAKPAESSPLAVLDTFDANLRARVGSLTFRQTPVQELAFDGTLQSGALTVRNASVRDVGGAAAKLAGTFSNLTGFPVFRGTYQVDARSVAGLARLAGFDPAAVPRGLGRATLSGSADGNAARLELDTRLAAAGGTLALKGLIEGLDSAPRFDVRLDGRHADASALGRNFGVDLAPPGSGALALDTALKGDLAALSVDAKLQLAGAESAVSGTVENPVLAPKLDLAVRLAHPTLAGFLALAGADYRPAEPRLGPVSLAAAVKGGLDRLDITGIEARAGKAALAGEARLVGGGARPRLTARLSAGEIAVDPFLPAEERAEAAPRAPVVPAAVAPAAGRSERWSRDRLDLAALDALDAEISVEARALTYRAMRVDGAKLSATLADRVLALGDLSGRMFDGAFAATGRLDGRAVPALAATLRVDRANVAKALFETASLDLASGVLSFEADIAGNGESEHALVSALSGKGRFAVRDGVAKGFDLRAASDRLKNIDRALDLVVLLGSALQGGQTRFSALDGTFRIDRGVIATDDTRLVADAGAGNAVGTIDLPRWVMNMRAQLALSEHPGAPPIGVRLEGPVDEPRRIIEAQALQAYLVQRGLGSVLRRVAPEAGPATAPPQAPQPQPPQRQPDKIDPKDLLRGLLQGLGR